ncbi:nitrophenyl compound nitroreductase subunit ArsF family protein [Carboxylicivirga sp. M1479]|uniref:nitrophenyl compound nitroreductase subunit ArsF family protein n=1 Tax=Carboxylicivirga sp. M1479 TaxID=2594476 RepID=UPI001178B888|nr:nitrophenyl compound nitroreductase subunit ArsF family protein [Carboxylicivirga sp. M1479]TRX70969.1 thioredoxin family protein [Carboxylicivirga sp. M1479]
MNNLLKQSAFVLTLAALVAFTTACNSKAKKSDSESSTALQTATVIDTSVVNVVYFHATRRCATCEAVESVTKETLAEVYKGKVNFISINREHEKELAKQYKVDWQTLLVLKGEQQINLTNEAFLNARTKPEKLKALLQSSIDSML